MVTLYRNGDLFAQVSEHEDIVEGFSVNGRPIGLDFTALNSIRGGKQEVLIFSDELAGKTKATKEGVRRLPVGIDGEGSVLLANGGYLTAKLDNPILTPVEREHGDARWKELRPNTRWARA